MDLGKLPEQGTIALVVVTACITTLIVGVFGKKLAEFVLELLLWPVRRGYDATYRWVAPRNPFSISMRTYRRHVLRSNLTRMENPVGPSLDVPLEYAFAPLKLRSSTAQDAIDLFSHVATNPRCVILGGPGTGKTTLMKSLVTSIIKKHCHKDLNDLVPVFVVLRNLAKNQQTVFDAIVSAFDQYHFPGADNFVRSSLDAGKMLIVLDGLDEVGANREFVVEQILRFTNHDVQRVHQNRLLVTCREHSYKTADLQDGIPEVLQVEPFTNHHMRIFLEGWPPHKGRSAIKLFGLIQDDNQLRDICRNPLLLTILTGLYLDTENFEVPSSRERFYQNAIDELLIRRPARRQIKQQFNADDKRQILERVSLERLETVGRNEDPEELTQESIRTRAEIVLRTDKFDLHELLKEMVDINGIIKPAQENSYTCAHRTILEYFAAREAIRSRETKKVVDNFGGRPELIEVLYFYCGLLRNLPALTKIVHSFTAEDRWIEAGRSLLHMNEAPSAALVELVAARLYQEAIGQKETKESIGLLSSLANRRDPEFEAARRYFADAIDRLTSSSDSGASAIETAIATSPEIALKLIPGLLKHPSERWKALGVQLLRDVGVDEALDKLVQLLNDEDAYIRRSSAMILAEMIISRNQALRQRAVFLSEKIDRNIWPLERYFPGSIAIPIAEGLLSSTEGSKSSAINCAVLALKGKVDGRDDKILRHWRCVPRDVTIRRYRRSFSAGISLFGLSLFVSYLALLVGLVAFCFFTQKAFVFSSSSSPIQSFSNEPKVSVSNAAKQMISEIEVKYPGPSLHIWERVLSWNWKFGPEIPVSAKEDFAKLERLTGSRFDPFEVSLFPSFDQLTPISSVGAVEKVNEAISDLRKHLPSINPNFYFLTTGDWPSVFFVAAAALMSVFYVIVIRGPSRHFKSKPLLDDSLLRWQTILTGFTCAVYTILPVIGNLWMRFAIPAVSSLCIATGFVIYFLNWPNNPLIDTVAEVQGASKSRFLFALDENLNR